MKVRRGTGLASMATALVLVLLALLTLGNHDREVPGHPLASSGQANDTPATDTPPSNTTKGGTTKGGTTSSVAPPSDPTSIISTSSGTPPSDAPPGDAPVWMHRLAPGEQAPQFVLFSFDGAGSHAHWQRMLPLAKRVGAHFSGFLSGIYLLDNAHRDAYVGPGHPPGKASIGFGGSPAEVSTRITDLNEAVADGNEIGTHYNGHFCHGAEPSVGFWKTAQWNAELDQFATFVRNARAQGLAVDPTTIRGGRTPCLEGNWDQLFPALRAHGMDYDSSKVSTGVQWPELDDGVWEFWMPLVHVPALGGRRVIMMDYNFWASFNGAKDDPARSGEFTGHVLDTYRSVYQATFNGNRAPLVIANHFNDWAGGAFTAAAEQFMAESCAKPETVCATYAQVIQWMRLQDPAVLDQFRRLPNAQN